MRDSISETPRFARGAESVAHARARACAQASSNILLVLYRKEAYEACSKGSKHTARASPPPAGVDTHPVWPTRTKAILCVETRTIYIYLARIIMSRPARRARALARARAAAREVSEKTTRGCGCARARTHAHTREYNTHTHTPTVDTWLILPVVICLSQRLSHACLSISLFIRRDCGWLIKSVIVYLMV